MKRSVFLAYAVLLAAFLLPGLLADRPSVPPLPGGESAPPAASAPAPGPAAPDTVRLLAEGTVRELPMQTYLVGVLAGEMPASFEAEALKAQAVAARTYTMYCASGPKHPDADVCADPAHCQAWQAEDPMREKWGENYEKNRALLSAAVAATAGEYLSYEGKPVFAAFHASSAGATEDCGAVWNPRPYLVSVASPESAETVPNYISRLLCAPLDFRDVLLAARPEADLTGAPETWLGPVEHDASGRVASYTLGGVAFGGTELRRLFSLRSTAFTLEYTEGKFCFTVTGNGHGVGMSQYGANVMARDGADYRAILAHYYPGTTLTSEQRTMNREQ